MRSEKPFEKSVLCAAKSGSSLSDRLEAGADSVFEGQRKLSIVFSPPSKVFDGHETIAQAQDGMVGYQAERTSRGREERLDG